MNMSHEYFSLAAVLQIPAPSLNTCDKRRFDSWGQYHWSNKYVWCQSQRRNNRPTYAGAADQLQVCLARKQAHEQDIPGSYFALTKSNCCFLVLWSEVVAKRPWKLQVLSTASYSDKRPSSTLASTLLFVFPRSKSPIQIVSANSRRWILSKFAKVPEKCVSAQDGDSLQPVIPPNVSICRGNGLLYRRDVA